MLRRCGISLAALGWLLACSQVSGQTPSADLQQLPRLDRPAEYTGLPLSLNEAIEEALKNNPSLIVLQRQVNVARQRPAQQTSLPPPTLTSQIWQWPLNTLNPSNASMFMFMVEQDIPGRGKRSLRATAAAKDVDIAANDVTVTAQQTLSDLKHAYVALMTARKVADIYAEGARILRQLADAAEVKYGGGRISQQDVLKPAAELSTLYDDALVVRERADLAAAQLNALMGRPIDTPIGPLQEVTTSTRLPELTVLTEVALSHQPELQSARLMIERTNAARAVAKSESKPDFMVQGGYMLTPRATDAWTGQLTISWPSAPWARGGLNARVAEANADVAVAEARLTSAENSVRLAVQQAYVRARTADQRAVLLQTTIIPESRQTLEAARIGYESDRLDFLTVLESHRTFLEEQLSFVRAIADLADARADLERALGVSLEHIPAISAAKAGR